MLFLCVLCGEKDFFRAENKSTLQLCGYSPSKIKKAPTLPSAPFPNLLAGALLMRAQFVAPAGE